MDAEKTLVQTLEVLREDVKQFIETRYMMLRTELSASLRQLRAGALLMGTAAVCGLVGLILLGICAAFAVAMLFGTFPNQGAVTLGFLITGFAAVIVALAAGVGASSKLRSQELAPKRTLQVLRRDQEVLKEGGRQDEQTGFRRRA